MANTLLLKSLNHISIGCASVEKSVDFYVNVLGFSPIKRPSSLNFNGAWQNLVDQFMGVVVQGLQHLGEGENVLDRAGSNARSTRGSGMVGGAHSEGAPE
ncbi:hypothetical protein Fmac_020484 [Flemingia macrophylla]|uniref:Glyoxalase/fosfomycin resistance/dioxygenase domain-containing protein n=1 Tax=Flemingia macrophylla TaxID=520843 RepID=A0ABD1LU49_9FABA